jgi:hypothetical protein
MIKDDNTESAVDYWFEFRLRPIEYRISIIHLSARARLYNNTFYQSYVNLPGHCAIEQQPLADLRIKSVWPVDNWTFMQLGTILTLNPILLIIFLIDWKVCLDLKLL